MQNTHTLTQQTTSKIDSHRVVYNIIYYTIAHTECMVHLFNAYLNINLQET